MSEKNNNYGVLLVNLGTPDEPTPAAVKRFLGEFLYDKRVVALSRWLWAPILFGAILPIRSPKVAKLYQSIWMEEGSPLMVYSKRQVAKLKSTLSVPVELGMTYGTPTIRSGIDALEAQGCKNIVILPLYPQYSGTTTAAVFDRFAKDLKLSSVIPEFSFIRDYYDHPNYIQALAASVRQHWEENGKGEYLLCSYHGIPKRLADQGDVYPQHCEKTTELLAKELGLDGSQIGMSYQSRFGREEWLKPYTDETLEDLPKQGIKKLDIISPAFSVDCLETLEEISDQCRELYLEAGGEQYQFIPCLNDNDEHIEMMAQLIKGHLPSA